MNVQNLKGALGCISDIMTENRDYLVELDSRNGDGDLGISMSSGYQAVREFVNQNEETDLGKMLRSCSSVFNESAPSSLEYHHRLRHDGHGKGAQGQDRVHAGGAGRGDGCGHPHDHG